MGKNTKDKRGRTQSKIRTPTCNNVEIQTVVSLEIENC